MPSTWQRITDLFGAARALDATAREAFLAVACIDAPGVRQQVEALLSADAIDDGFLMRPPTTAIADVLRDGVDPVPDGVVLNNRYVVNERFASGGQGLVYRATDRVLSRPVVIKVMRAAHPERAVLRARFEREMDALARVHHPGVVGILDVGALDDGSPFLVLQHIDGVTLRQLLQSGPIEPERAARILQKTAAALAAAHAVGVAHQDLKPENVMVQQLADGSEAITLIDFGIAKIDQADLSRAFTAVLIAGSVRYMAPEQFEGRNLPASDTYALGLLACELLHGHPDVRAVPRRGRRRVRRLLDTAVAFHPEDRPTSVQDWADGLAAAVLARASWRGRLAATISALVLLLSIGAYTIAGQDPDESGRIIEKIGAFDPLQEGFDVHGTVIGTILQNLARTEYVGWRVATEDPGGGHYYRRLGARQKRWALARGWLLTAVMQPEEGLATTVVDFVGEGKRFDITVFRDGESHVVRLTTQLTPSLQGLEVRVPRSGAASYSTYELRFDASLQTADLWVDGEKRLSGYRGHSQFQDDAKSVLFGAAPYKSARGVASFQAVRLQINP